MPEPSKSNESAPQGTPLGRLWLERGAAVLVEEIPMVPMDRSQFPLPLIAQLFGNRERIRGDLPCSILTQGSLWGGVGRPDHRTYIGGGPLIDSARIQVLLWLSMAFWLSGCAGMHGSVVAPLHLSTDQARAICTSDGADIAVYLSSETATRVLLLPLGEDGQPRDGLDDALNSEWTTALADPDLQDDLPSLLDSFEAVHLPCRVRTHQEARALGRRLEADLVLWSPQSGSGAAARATLINRQPKLRSGGAAVWAWGGIDELDLPGAASGQGQWLGGMLVGIHLYRLELYDQARRVMERAIQAAQASGVTKELYALHSILGWDALLANAPLAAQAAFRLAEEEARAAGVPLWEAHNLRAQADVAAARGEIAEARRLYEAARARYGILENERGQGDTYLGQASIAFQLSDLKEARTLYAASLVIFQRDGDPGRQALALQGLGNVAMWRCDYPTAEDYYTKAMMGYRAIGLRLGNGVMLQRLGDVKLWLADHAAATRHYQRALSIFRSEGDAMKEASCLMALGNARRVASQLDEASGFYRQALKAYSGTGDVLGQAHALRALGDIFSLGTSYDDARFSFDRALQLYRAGGSSQGEAATLRGLAYLERSFGVGYARRQYESALYLSHKAGDRLGEAHSRLGLGQLAVSREDYHEARTNFERARALYADAGYPVGEARSLSGLAEAFWGLGDGASAEVFYQAAVRVYQDAGLKAGEMQAHLNYGQAAMRFAELEKASDAYRRAAALARVLNDRQGEADTVFLLGRLAARRGDQERAAKGFETARELYRQLGVVRSQAIASADLGTALLSMGDEKRGKAMLEEATLLFDQIGMNGEADSCRSLIIAPPVLGDRPVTAG